MKRHRTASRKPAKTRHRNTTSPKRSIASKATRGASSSVAELQKQIERQARELGEAREQQTATSEVLKVISSSPGELEPVFQAMLENAVRICEAKFGNIYRWDGDALRVVATHNTPDAFAKVLRRSPVRPHPKSVLGRVLADKTVAHAVFAPTGDGYTETERDPSTVAAVELGGVRTALAVPMLKKNELIGAFAVNRQEVRPFTDKQIELVQNFAAQAVIAIENTRLLNELRQRTSDLTESLEQQTATSEVLGIISSSPGDLKPVFNSMLENAVRICDAAFGNIYRWHDGALHLVAGHNTPPAFAKARRRSPVNPAWNPLVGRMVATKMAAHMADVAAHPGYIDRSDPGAVSAVELGGVRTALAVPMLKDNELIGSFTLYRQQPRPFTDKQIELVQNFAAQAVIAIENTRLLNDLRQRTDDLSEALEQQTATSEVLRAISSSQGELGPVVQAMLENATRICEAKSGFLFRAENDGFRIVASSDDEADVAGQMKQRTFKFGPSTPIGRAQLTRQIVHVPNLAEDQAYLEGEPLAVWGVEQAHVRTLLVVPMLKDEELIGIFGIHREEVKPFAGKHIALVQNFAAQAVIAIENTRLLNELRQSLEQQTATADVLKVISSSRGNLEPVFEAMLENATRICAASFGSMVLRDGDGFRRVALHNAPPEFAEFNKKEPFIPAGGSSTLDQIMTTKQILHLPVEDPDTPLARFAGARTVLGVPLLKDNELIGVFGIYRREILPFTDKQIELAKNFAAQAVIAIENARPCASASAARRLVKWGAIPESRYRSTARR